MFYKVKQLQEVKASKDQLFGKFSGTEVTRDSKKKAWDDVAARCVVLGFPRFAGKSVVDLRDNLFGRKKKALKEKMDKGKKTGAKAVTYKTVFLYFLSYISYITHYFSGRGFCKRLLMPNHRN